MSASPEQTTLGAESALPYQLPTRELAGMLGTSLTDGLTAHEARRRLQTQGRNEVGRRDTGMLRIFVRRLTNALTLVLFAAMAISWALGDVSDAVIIGVVVFADLAVGFLYESYTRYKIELIQQQVPRIAEVIRGGRPRLVPAEELVVGDLIVLRRGERVPADGRLSRVVGLRVDESVLTGEPGDVSKVTTALVTPSLLADQRNMVFAGTVVTTGGGHAVVVATGARSVLGSLVRRVVEAGWHATPLESRLKSTGQLLGAGILLAASAVFVLGVHRGETPHDMFRSALTLAVAAIPEDLTFILTIALAVGATRLLKRRAVVRHLVAAETLGDATVVATDKTGTITTGKLVLQRVEGVSESFGSQGFADVSRHPLFRRALVGAVAGTDAGAAEETLRGSALERALREAVRTSGIDPSGLRREMPLFSILAFDPRFRYHASLHDDPGSQDPVLFAVGAPEVLLQMCVAASDGTRSVPLAEEVLRKLLQRAADAAASGARVLAVGTRHLGRAVREISRDDIAHLSFLALLVFEDPLRPDAESAVRELQRAGVRVMLLTGDHQGTAVSVGRATNILSRGDADVLDGAAVDQLSDRALPDRLRRVAVVSRVDPLQKERIIEALQHDGHIVAMIGDGVNDAVALRRADLGVAVATATDVAKDASDLVLLDGGLHVLTAAVQEGRRIRETVRTVLAYLFSTNMTEVFAVAASLFLAVPIPFLPAQLLWINVVTDGTADMALALEPASTRRGDATPGRRKGLFRLSDLFGMVFTSISLLLPTLLAYLVLFDVSADLSRARTAAFVTLAAGQLFTAFSYRSLTIPLARLSLFGNPWLLLAEALSFGLLVVAVHWPPLAGLLETTPLSPPEWAAVLALAFLGFLGVEARKYVVARFRIG